MLEVLCAVEFVSFGGRDARFLGSAQQAAVGVYSVTRWQAVYYKFLSDQYIDKVVSWLKKPGGPRES